MATEDSVSSVPLLLRRHALVEDRDPQVLAERLARHYVVSDFAPRQGHEYSFMHRSATVAAGSLLVTGGYTTPVQGTIGACPGIAAINLCYDGAARYQIDGLNLEIGARRPLYFAPEREYRYTSEHYNGAVFHVEQARLRSTAAAIAGLGISTRRFSCELDVPRAVSADDKRCLSYLRQLRRSLALLDEPLLEGSGELRFLEIDDLIYRILALLLCPSLERQIAAQEDGSSHTRERIFDELLEWIDAHITESINLTALEQRSGYSRRHLQLSFQQRFGCGPIQWVRRRRLEKARQALLEPRPDDSVAAIATRFGFSSVQVFSRDFHDAFGVRPSELLREGRRQQF